MTVSRHPQITEELLSAYLDNEVTPEERALVERVIAADPDIAWEVESLRQTVHLLQALPPLALPRAFTLEATMNTTPHSEVATSSTDVLVTQPTKTTPKAVSVAPTAENPGNQWWQWWLQIWQGGNLQLRNAAAVAFALFIVLFTSNQLAGERRSQAFTTPTAVIFNQESVPTLAVVDSSAAKLPASDTVTTPTTQPASTAAPTPAPTEAPTEAPVESVAAENGNTATNAQQPAAGTETRPASAAASQGQDAPKAPGEDLSPLGEDPVVAAAQAQRAMSTELFGDSAQKHGQPNPSGAETMPAPANKILSTLVVTATNIVTLTESISVTESVTNIESTANTATLSALVITVTATTEPASVPHIPDAGTAPAGRIVTVGPARWLWWAQGIMALSTVVLGMLWWRSRG